MTSRVVINRNAALAESVPNENWRLSTQTVEFPRVSEGDARTFLNVHVSAEPAYVLSRPVRWR